MRRLLTVLFISGVFVASVARADTISFSPVTVNLTPGPDTLVFDMDTFSFTAPTIVSQTGTYVAVFAPAYMAVIPFSFQESITVGGITKLLTFTGSDRVTVAFNDVTLDPLGSVQFGAYRVSFRGDFRRVGDYSPQPFDLTASISLTPEPSTLALCGTGLLAVAGLARRKGRTIEV